MPNAVLGPASRVFLSRGFAKPSKPVLDPSHPLSRGLVGCWLLGDNASGVTRDIAQNNNAGFVGSPTLTTSHHGGQALSLSGSGQYVVTQTLATYDILPATWAGWIKTSSLNGGSPAVASLGLNSSSGEATLFLDGTTAKLHLQLIPSGVDITGGASLTDGKWHHVAMTVQTGGVCTLYVDGVSVATGTSGGTWTFLAGHPIRFGSSEDGFWKNFLGAMEGWRVYGRLLSPTEIARLYVEPYAGIYNLGAVIALPVPSGSGVSVTIALAALTLAGFALPTNAKYQTAISQTLIKFAGFSLNVNAKSFVSIVQAPLILAARALTITGATLIAFTQGILRFGGQALNTGGAVLNRLSQLLGIGN